MHPERVDPEVIGVLGVARRDVAGDALVEAELPEQAERGGEALLAVQALFLDRVERRQVRGEGLIVPVSGPWLLRSFGNGRSPACDDLTIVPVRLRGGGPTVLVSSALWSRTARPRAGASGPLSGLRTGLPLAACAAGYLRRVRVASTGAHRGTRSRHQLLSPPDCRRPGRWPLRGIEPREGDDPPRRRRQPRRPHHRGGGRRRGRHRPSLQAARGRGGRDRDAARARRARSARPSTATTSSIGSRPRPASPSR